jgi:hypothetical protein
MNRSTRFLITGLGLGLTAALLLAASPAPATGSLTVGEFAEMVAARMQPSDSGQATASPQAALEKLSKAGVKIGADPSEVLSAGDAVGIFQQFGITIQAEHPEAIMSRDRAQALVNTFGDTFAARAEGASASQNLVIRGGNGSQISGAPGLEALEDCQSLPKNKDCHECCANMGLPKRVCGKACSNGKKASGSEPTP